MFTALLKSKAAKLSVCVFVISCRLAWSAAPVDRLTTPYTQTGNLKIHNVSLSSPTVTRFSRIELTVDFSASFDNPFELADVALDANFRAPSGKTLFVPGFFYKSFARALKDGHEVLSPEGSPSWRIRFTPVETGSYTAVVTVRDRSGKVESAPVTFTVAASETPGFIGISKVDRRYFAFENGQPYFPIGADVCWAGGRGTFDYDQWLARYSEAGCNYARLWLSPHWSTFALEQPGKRDQGKGLGQFDLANAWRLDYVLDAAAQRGIYLMFCIDSYKILRQKDGYPQWDNTPHNAANGGPLKQPGDFWTNLTMAQLYRDKLRYLVARYGYSPHVLSWEFWNEVDIITGYRTAAVRDWHARMAVALRALDPFHHLLTTSFANTVGDKEVDTLPGLDYVQTHHYNSPDLAVTVAKAQAQKTLYGKPHIVGEIGADSSGGRSKDDPQGLQIHDPLWVSIAAGCSGTAQPWWWDNYIHPRNLYPLFGAVARFAAGIDWPREGFRSIKPRAEWQTKPDPLSRVDLAVKTSPASWDASELNRPRRVSLTRAGVQGELPLSAIQHGVGGHRDLHNPATFEIDLPWPTRCEVEVGEVSGHGGAALKMTLDGQTALAKDFPDPDGSKDTRPLKQFAGVYGLDVPPGRHTLVVENIGADWFMASYRFRNAIEPTGPPLLSWALVGTNTVLVWSRVEDRTWQRICGLKAVVPSAPASVLLFPGLTPGLWTAELWDTWNGTITETREIIVPPSGEARLSLPPIEKDLAIKLRRKR